MEFASIALSGVVAAVVSGVLSWWISSHQQSKHGKRALFGRLMAHRGMPLRPEFFEALNEIPATFADDKRVVAAWVRMLREGQGADNENLIHTLREAARAAAADISSLNDDDLVTAFTQPPPHFFRMK